MWKFGNSSPDDEVIQGTGKLDGRSQEVSLNFLPQRNTEILMYLDYFLSFRSYVIFTQ